MSQNDEPGDLLRCTCSPEELLRFLKVVFLDVEKQDIFKFRELCHSKKGRAEILKNYDSCVHCRCQVCHPVPLLAISSEYRVLLLRLPPVLDTALTSSSRSSAQSRRAVLKSIADQLNRVTHNQFTNGAYEDYYWSAHYEASQICNPLEVDWQAAVPSTDHTEHIYVPARPGYGLEPVEEIFTGQPEDHIYQCLILRATLNSILNLPTCPRQAVIARLKQVQAKDKHLRVTPILWKIVQRAYFDNSQEARFQYERIRNYGKDANEGYFRPPIHAGEVPELQILLLKDQPAANYKIGSAKVYEYLPQEMLCLALYYEALRRTREKLPLGQLSDSYNLSELLKQHRQALEGFFWQWESTDRKKYLQSIQQLLKTFNDQYLPSNSSHYGLKEVKEARFKVSENLLDLADCTELHQVLEKATRHFFQNSHSGQLMLDYLEKC